MTHQFVVVLRADDDTVTQIPDVEAHARPTASVEAHARVGVARRLVLPTRAVEDAVTADVDWQTVAVPRTLEVGPRTTPGRQTLHSEPARVVEDYHPRRRGVLDPHYRQPFDVAATFVQFGRTVLHSVTPNFAGKALLTV